MPKLALHSDDSFVAFGKSGSAVTENDSARLFPLVQNASISVDVAGSRQVSRFLGQDAYGYDEIVKQPEVSVDLSYYLSPFGINEKLFGFTGVEGSGMNSFLTNVRDYNNNIYFFFNEKEPQEGFSEPRYKVDNTWSNYNIVGVGNCYLTRYSVNWQLHRPVMVNVSFVGGNMMAVNGSPNVPVPSKLYNGNSPSGYVLPLNELYSGLASGLPSNTLGRTGYNPSVTLPYKCSFELSELQCGGISISTGSKPVLQSVALDISIDRTPHYGLGSNYPMTRKANWPINGSVGVDFLVSGIKAGELQTLVSNETGHYLKFVCREFKDSGVYMTYEIEKARLEAQTISCDIHEVYKCSMKFSFDDLGYSTTSEIPYDDTFDIYLGGYFDYNDQVSASRIISLQESGANVDTSFNYGSGFNGTIHAVAIQTGDGKIIFGGEFTSYNGTACNRIARINTDGSYDSSFNIGSGFDNTVRAVTIQSDGKILVGGDFTTYKGSSQVRMIRLDASGNKDATLDIGTGFTDPARNENPNVYDIYVNNDGTMLVVGGFTSYNGTLRNRIVKLTSTGAIDNTFYYYNGYNAILLHTINSGYVRKIYKNQSGNYMILGNVDRYNNLSTGAGYVQCMEVSPTGYSDINASNYGIIYKPLSINVGYALCVLQLPNGDFFIGGTMSGTNDIFGAYTADYFYKVTSTGAWITTFGETVNSCKFVAGGAVRAMARQTDGKIIICGDFTSYRGVPVRGIARIYEDGRIDPTFNTGDFIDGSVTSVAVNTSNNKNYFTGSFTRYKNIRNRLLKLKPTGLQNSSFSNQYGFNGEILAMTRESGGDIIVCGDFTSYRGVQCGNIARIRKTGELDSMFAANVGTGTNNKIRAVVIQPNATRANQKIFIAGDFTTFNGSSYNGLIKLNLDGTIDTSFVVGTGFAYTGTTMTIRALALNATRLFVGGNFSSYRGTNINGIVAINITNGSIDGTFSVGAGFNLYAPTGTVDPVMVKGLVVQSDGKVVAIGDFSSFNSTTRTKICRISTSGASESTTTFTIGTGFTSTATNVPLCIGLQSDGKIIIGGNFTTYNTSDRSNLLRLNTNGTFDSTFGTSAGANNKINDLKVLPDNTILVGGLFTSIHGSTTENFAKLNSNGTVNLTTTELDAGAWNTISAVAF